MVYEFSLSSSSGLWALWETRSVFHRVHRPAPLAALVEGGFEGHGLALGRFRFANRSRKEAKP